MNIKVARINVAKTGIHGKPSKENAARRMAESVARLNAWASKVKQSL